MGWIGWDGSRLMVGGTFTRGHIGPLPGAGVDLRAGGITVMTYS